MERPLIAVLLAGTLRPLPLREALDIPVVCLPLGRQGTVLDSWLRSLAAIDNLNDIRIVLNTDRDAATATSSIEASRAFTTHEARIRAIAEPASWRGAGGILRDVATDCPDDTLVIVCEAIAMPPESIWPLLQGLPESADGVVGVYGEDQPSGVYAFSRKAISKIPAVGYHDLKEQFLPLLAAKEFEVRTAQLEGELHSLRDRNGYLAGAAKSLEHAAAGESPIRSSSEAAISISAKVDGSCIIQSGVIIEDNAVVHDSVLLRGSTIQASAVVSKSIIAPGATVASDARVVREVFVEGSQAADHVTPAERGSVRVGENA